MSLEFLDLVGFKKSCSVWTRVCVWSGNEKANSKS
jgi:hypothetical protein